MAKRIGLRDLYAFKIESVNEKTGEPTYGQPFRIAKAIEAGLSKTVAEQSLYADDSLDEYVAETTGMTLTLNTNELEPEVSSQLLGLKVDELGGISNTPDALAPYFAVAFRSKLSTGGYEYRVLYRVRFKPTDENYKTKGESVEFQQPTLTGACTIREDLNLFDYALRDTTTEAAKVCKEWFKAVQKPKDSSKAAQSSPGVA